MKSPFARHGKNASIGAADRDASVPVDLYLLGIGIRGLRQITWETFEVLQRCRKVLHLSGAHSELCELNPNTESLDAIYWTGDDWHRAARRIVKRVLDEVGHGPEVALVSSGSPTLFDDIGMELQKRLRRARKRCVALPAVSCLATLSIDLGIDYGDGLQVLEATHLVNSQVQLDPQLHTLLLQIFEFDTWTTPDAIEHCPGRFEPLVQYLEQFYPESHRIVLAYSDDGTGDGPLLMRGHLSTLDSKSSRMFPGMTLYLPPILT